MEHKFNTNIASVTGVDGAIMMNHLFYWIQKNAANNKNFHDGRCWTYNSADAFTKIFRYWTGKQVRRIIDNLILDGYIIKGNYNENRLDRTAWFTFTDKGIELLKSNDYDTNSLDLPKWENANDETGKCITNNNTTNNKEDKEKNRLSNDNQKKENISFEDFYKLYPLKKSRKPAEMKWKNLSIKDKKAAIEMLPIYLADCAKEKRMLKHPSTYLSQRTWEDDFTPVEAEEQENNKQPNGLPVGLTEGRWHKFQSWGKKNIPSIIDNITPCMFLDMQRESCFRTGIMVKVLCDMEKKPSTGELLQDFIILCEGKYSEDIKKSIGLT